MAVVCLGLIGSALATSSSTVVIPITVNVPRSDPANGATVVVIYETVYYSGGSAATSGTVGDDAPMDSFYNTCYYSDGLNHYGNLGVGFIGTPFNNYNTFSSTSTISPPFTSGAGFQSAVIFNPLVGGVNNITLTYSPTSPDVVAAYAVAYTGLQLGGRPQDTPPFLWHTSYGTGGYLQSADPLSGGTVTGVEVNWVYNQIVGGGSGPNVIGPPFLEVPGRAPSSPTPYPDYQWVSPGDLIAYCVIDVNHGGGWSAFNPVVGPVIGAGDFETGASGGWTWGGPVTSIFQDVDVDPVSSGFPLSIAFATQTPPSLPYTADLTGSWAGIQSTYTFGSAALLVGGNGPLQCAVPPPPGNYPVFNSRWRSGSLSTAGASIDA